MYHSPRHPQQDGGDGDPADLADPQGDEDDDELDEANNELESRRRMIGRKLSSDGSKVYYKVLTYFKGIRVSSVERLPIIGKVTSP